MGFALFNEIPTALKQLDILKSVSYIQNAQKSSVNIVSKQMGGEYYKNKSLPFHIIDYYPKNKDKPTPSTPSERKSRTL